MSYTFRSDAVTSTEEPAPGHYQLPVTNVDQTEPNVGLWGAESLKNWPDLCKEGTKGTILLGLASGNKPIYPDGKTTGYFFGEALLPYEEFVKSGYKVIFISPDGTAFPDWASIHGKNAEKYSIQVWNDKTHPIHRSLQKIYRPEDFTGNNLAVINALYCAGGHQCVWSFSRATNLQNLAAKIWEQGGVIGLDCHAPALLGNLILSNGTKLVTGKRATGFSTSLEEKFIPGILAMWQREGLFTIEETIKLNGGKWEESSSPMSEFVVRDGRLITGMNPASAKKVALEMLDILNAAMATGGTINYDKITGKTERLNKQQQGELAVTDQHKSLLAPIPTSSGKELPSEFHRSPQPYEIDHPMKNM